MHITEEQLEHLANLASLELTDTEKERLLPHLEQILAFVGKLQEVDVEHINPLAHPQGEVTLQTQEGVEQFANTQGILRNIQHEQKNNAVGVKPATRE